MTRKRGTYVVGLRDLILEFVRHDQYGEASWRDILLMTADLSINIPKRKVRRAVSCLVKRGAIQYMDHERVYRACWESVPADPKQYYRAVLEVLGSGEEKEFERIAKEIEEEGSVRNYDINKLSGYIGALSGKDMIHEGEKERGWVIGPDPKKDKKGSQGGGGSEDTSGAMADFLFKNMRKDDPIAMGELKEIARQGFPEEEVEANILEAYEILMLNPDIVSYLKKLSKITRA